MAMSSQSVPSGAPWKSRWAVEIVERYGIEEQLSADWENGVRRHATGHAVGVLCRCGQHLATYGLPPPVKGDPEPGPVQFLRGREPRMRTHPTNTWLTMSRIVWECRKCGFSRPTTRLALQDAVEDALAAGRREVVLGLDL